MLAFVHIVRNQKVLVKFFLVHPVILCFILDIKEDDLCVNIIYLLPLISGTRGDFKRFTKVAQEKHRSRF